MNSVVCSITSALRWTCWNHPQVCSNQCLPGRRWNSFNPENGGSNLFRRTCSVNLQNWKSYVLWTCLDAITWTANMVVHDPLKCWCPPKTCIVYKPRIMSSWHEKCLCSIQGLFTARWPRIATRCDPQTRQLKAVCALRFVVGLVAKQRNVWNQPSCFCTRQGQERRVAYCRPYCIVQTSG